MPLRPSLLFGAICLLATSEVHSEVRYYHTDILGSVAAISNEAGEIIERREYSPFGAQLAPALRDGPGFTSHVADSSTGLIQMQQRSMDPVTGRFVSVDPVGVFDFGRLNHFNRYAYAYNNPTSLVDPDGRIPWLGGALFGGGLDVGIQVAELAMGTRSEFSITSVLVSSAGGAIGVGIAGKFNRLGGLVADAALSVGTTAAKGDEITVAGVVADVALGEGGERLAAKAIRQSPDYKVAERGADRLQRIGQSRKHGKHNKTARPTRLECWSMA